MASKDTKMIVTNYRAPSSAMPPSTGMGALDHMAVDMYVEFIVEDNEEFIGLPPITVQAIAVSAMVSAMKGKTMHIISGTHEKGKLMVGLRDGGLCFLDQTELPRIKGYKPVISMGEAEVVELQDVFDHEVHDVDNMITALGIVAKELEDGETEVLHTDYMDHLLKDIPLIDTVGIDHDQQDQSS